MEPRPPLPHSRRLVKTGASKRTSSRQKHILSLGRSSHGTGSSRSGRRRPRGRLILEPLAGLDGLWREGCSKSAALRGHYAGLKEGHARIIYTLTGLSFLGSLSDKSRCNLSGAPAMVGTKIDERTNF